MGRFGSTCVGLRAWALVGALLAALLLALPARALACTAIYVGSEASDDGTTIIVRSNDMQGLIPSHAEVVDAVSGEAGRTATVDAEASVFTDLPEDTFKYVHTPFTTGYQEREKWSADSAVAANEYGVSMTMSVTAFSNDSIKGVDPYQEHGLSEDSANSLVVCQSKSAREGVEKLLAYVDEYGITAGSIAFIADRDETWYVEMLSGHQYVAVVLPKDKVCVFGNEFNLDFVSSYEDSIVSADLEKTAVDAGTAKYSSSGELDINQSYAKVHDDYSHMRTWMGHKILAPSAYGDYDINDVYPLCFDAESKVSLCDCLQLIRNRYEGTEYAADDPARNDMLVIGTDTAMSVHALQVYPELDADMNTVLWYSSGPAVLGVFVPISNISTHVSDSYERNQTAEEADVIDTQNMPYYTFKALSEVGLQDMAVYGKPVQAYFAQAEQSMSAGMAEVLQTAKDSREQGKDVDDYITDYCDAMQEAAFADGVQIYDAVYSYWLKNSNTYQLAMNPETHETSGSLKTYEPISIKQDAGVYAEVPKYSPHFADSSALTAGVINKMLLAAVAAGAISILVGAHHSRKEAYRPRRRRDND